MSDLVVISCQRYFPDCDQYLKVYQSLSAFSNSLMRYAALHDLKVTRWLPDVDDPLLLYRLQREYERERDTWYARWKNGESQEALLVAQKRLAQAIVALGSS